MNFGFPHLLFSRFPPLLILVPWFPLPRFPLPRFQSPYLQLSRVVCNVPHGRSATESLIGHKKNNIQDRNNYTSNSPYTTTCLPCRTYTRMTNHSTVPTDIILFLQPRTDTVTASFAFAVAAPRIWNSLPLSITACINYCTFKTKLKTRLFST